MKFLREVIMEGSAEKSTYICLTIPKARDVHDFEINIKGLYINRQAKVEVHGVTF